MAEPARVYRLSSDYSCGFPVWGPSGGLASTAQLGISDELAADLTAWQDLFDQSFRYDGSGWSSPEAEAEYAHAAPDLRRRLARELGSASTVMLDLWPVTDKQLLVWVRHHDRPHS